jgi:hypothetical protein
MTWPTFDRQKRRKNSRLVKDDIFIHLFLLGTVRLLHGRAYLAPRDARYLAVPSPMPELAPVTRTTFPANSGILPLSTFKIKSSKNKFRLSLRIINN